MFDESSSSFKARPPMASDATIGVATSHRRAIAMTSFAPDRRAAMSFLLRAR
jgi:hypothetical protein